MDEFERLRKGSRRTGALFVGLGVVTACAAIAIAALGLSVDLGGQIATICGAAALLAVGAAVALVGRWLFYNGAEDVVGALQNDPRAIVSVEYKRLRSFQLFRPDRHHLVFQLRDTRSTVAVSEDDVVPLLNFVRTRSPNAAVTRIDRPGPF